MELFDSISLSSFFFFSVDVQLKPENKTSDNTTTRFSRHIYIFWIHFDSDFISGKTIKFILGIIGDNLITVTKIPYICIEKSFSGDIFFQNFLFIFSPLNSAFPSVMGKCSARMLMFLYLNNNGHPRLPARLTISTTEQNNIWRLSQYK